MLFLLFYIYSLISNTFNLQQVMIIQHDVAINYQCQLQIFMIGEEDQSFQKFQTEVELVQEQMKDFTISMRSETVYFLGLTGSGKSSLINYLLGADLIPKKQAGVIKLINDEKSGIWPIIGNSNTSCTSIPSIYKDKTNDMVYVDPAGFMDTKGSIQQVINGYANARMFKRGSKIKILLVIENATLHSGRGQLLAEISSRLQELFPSDFAGMIHSMMIVVSKVPADDDLEDVRERIQSISQQNKTFKKQAVFMVNSILKKNNIVIYPNARIMTKQIAQSIREKIAILPYFVLSAQAIISIDSKAKIMMQEFSNQMAKQFRFCLKEIRLEFENKYLHKSYKNSGELQITIYQLKSALSILKNQIDTSLKDSFLAFSESLGLPPMIQNRVLLLMDKIEFFNTLRICVTGSSKKIVDEIASMMKEQLVVLDNKLSKQTTAEQFIEISNKHEESLLKREEKYQVMIMEISKESAIREQKTKKELLVQNQRFQEILKQQNKSHLDQIESLNKQIMAMNARLNPPPPPKDRCFIM